MSDGRLFIVELTGGCRVQLRRFNFSKPGEEHSCSATVIIAEDAPITPHRADGTKQADTKRVKPDDPRWPTRCDTCGAPLVDGEYQTNELDWYEGGGERFTFGIGSWDGPPGAMFRTPWRDTDGRPPAWLIFLPNRTAFNTNDRASGSGAYWQVIGEPPALTLQPSIDDQGARPWHGWIRDGVMTSA